MNSNYKQFLSIMSTLNHCNLNKNRITSIDALRGFALFGILMIHCIERFDLDFQPVIDSPFWEKIDKLTFHSIDFIFGGKSYAIFSLLFGLGFFIQMESQKSRGTDFRLRFLWRLALLFTLGFLYALIYTGDFFRIYAITGIILIPLYKAPTKWLILIAILLLLQLPEIFWFVSSLRGETIEGVTTFISQIDDIYIRSAEVFIHGSFWDVLHFNLKEGQLVTFYWSFGEARYPQMIGLFILGMLIGRSGIYKDEKKIILYSRKLLPYSIACSVIFKVTLLSLPFINIKGMELIYGDMLFSAYANLSMGVMYISVFMLLYHTTKNQNWIEKIAPFGRMSVTNYVMAGLICVPLFYGYGFNLAVQLSYLQSCLSGLVLFAFQVLFSNWWIKQYYFGPFEWLWRSCTWLKFVPLKRKATNTP